MWVIGVVVVFLIKAGLGYVLINAPDEVNWGIEGQSLSLHCQVDESWQWCYWQVSRSVDQV